MNSNIKGIVSLLLAITMLLSLPVISFADDDGNDDYFFLGRQGLASLARGELLVEAYDRVVECIEEHEKRADLKDLVISAEELTLVVDTYRNDAHGHFWVANTYSMTAYSESHIASFIPDYNSLAGENEEDLEKNREIFDDAVDALLKKAGIRSSMSDYEKEKRIHDALVTSNTYKSGENAHNEFGALVEHQSVCQGYSLAFQYLLRQVGIPACSVVGYSRNEYHSWNLVYIDGEYYYTDATWDDPLTDVKGDDSDIFYGYFNVTADYLSKDHTWTPPVYGLPECSATKDNYYTHNPANLIDLSLITEEAVAALFKNGFARIEAKNCTASDIGAWFFDHAFKIAALCGYDLTKETGANYTLSGDEIHLFIIGTLPEPEYLLGDLDSNGKVNSVDSNLLKRIIIGNLLPTDIQKKAGDMDTNQSLNNIDANLHKRIVLGN